MTTTQGKTSLIFVLSGWLLLLWSTLANAAVVTVTFDALPFGFHPANYFESGFRISPNYHLDGVEGYAGTVGIGWDRENIAFGATRNPDFLGPPGLGAPGGSGAVVYVDRDGLPFSFGLVDILGPEQPVFGGDPFPDPRAVEIQSSKGGFFRLPPGYGVCPPQVVLCFWPRDTLVSLNGPEWTEIEWLMFVSQVAGFAESPFLPFAQIDQLTLLVGNAPEPASLALLGVALAGLAFSRRRKLH
jgi:hypothetical protein